ncbi:MAG: ribonuclease HII [Clostridium sp.]|nr:ribonuclease HII [Clostridium sp.]
MSLNPVEDNIEAYEIISNALLDDERKNVRSLGDVVKKTIEQYEKEVIRVKALYDFDKSFGYEVVAGVDEVGRGPLAGPIVAAAVVLNNNDKDLILRINDSKKISKDLREELSEIIKTKAISYSIAIKSNKEIDELGIGYCNNEIFKEAISSLNIKPDIVLSDGYTIKGFDMNNEAVIKGDTKSAAIACASIIAKVYRDKLMEEYSEKYTHYGFEKNVGYGTKEHMEAIVKHGSCDIHRETFIRNIIK